MRTIQIGSLTVSALGEGAMGLGPGGIPRPTTEEEALRVIRAAADAGVTLFDTADAYGGGINEQLIGQALAGRTNITIATKIGLVLDPSKATHIVETNWGPSLPISNDPGYLRQAVEGSLKRLGRDTIDLLYLHYVDPKIPLEDTVGLFAEFVKEGKVKEIGLSNVTADQVERASKVHHIAAVENNFSIMNRQPREDMLPLTRRLGTTFVAWSPLGGGLLTKDILKLPPDDFRLLRLEKERIPEAARSVDELFKIAEEMGITAAQLSLAWLYHQGDNVIAIPGMRTVESIPENLVTPDIQLSDEQLRRLNALTFGYKQILG
jgi:aryl-alcohol dehydrogenase-like predicted oxidoreductase